MATRSLNRTAASCCNAVSCNDNEPHSHSGGPKYGIRTVSCVKSGIGAGFHTEDDGMCREKRPTKRTMLWVEVSNAGMGDDVR